MLVVNEFSLRIGTDMLRTRIRKQGGAAVVTLPAEVLRQIDLTVGEELQIELTGETIILRAHHEKRRRYSLAELLEGVDCAEMQQIAEETRAARAGGPKGRELL